VTPGLTSPPDQSCARGGVFRSGGNESEGPARIIHGGSSRPPLAFPKSKGYPPVASRCAHCNRSAMGTRRSAARRGHPPGGSRRGCAPFVGSATRGITSVTSADAAETVRRPGLRARGLAPFVGVHEAGFRAEWATGARRTGDPLLSRLQRVVSTLRGARRDDSPVATKEQQVPGATFVRAAELVRRPDLSGEPAIPSFA
jgi:hypothetical protein